MGMFRLLISIISINHEKKKNFFFFNIINRKLTIGNLSSIIASLVFAIILRHVYLHLLEY